MEQVWTDLRVVRASNLPDLVVTSFSCELEEAETDGRTVESWRVVAEISNQGEGDLRDRLAARLEVSGWGEMPEPEREFLVLAYSRTTHPALGAGANTTIEWREDRPTPTGNRISLSTANRFLRVVVDPEDQH